MYNDVMIFKKMFPFLALLILILLVLLFKVFGLRFNYTESMPIGFYKSVKAAVVHRGDLVAVCLPKDIADEGLRRHYLKRGSCSSGVIPVLKKVVGVPGDTVWLSKKFITVNGLMYPAPQQVKDHLHKPMRHFVRNGSYAHTTNYWLYGANDPSRSWDSRYYGGIARSNIIGVFKPLLTL